MAQVHSTPLGQPARPSALGRPGQHVRAPRSHPILILQIVVIVLMVIPSTAVFRPIGAVGYPAGLVGMFAFLLWAASTVLGLHDPEHRRHPVRGVFCLFWLTVLISYVTMSPDLTYAQTLSAERYPMQLAVMTGIALVTAECLNSMEDVRKVLRALVWGAAFCGVVAALQFWGNFDLTHYLKLPGFSMSALNSLNSAIWTRGSLNRVAGTAGNPIELGVTAAMLLPLALVLAMHDTDRSFRRRWAPVPLIALTIPASVSRSAVVGIALSIGTLIVLMPARQRVVALAGIPLALAAVFMTSHGLIGTFASYFSGKDGNSIGHRTNNYPYAEHLVRQAPLFGHGGGTHINDVATVASSIHVFDNQYLTTVVELGLIGVLVLAALFLVPMIAALKARKRSKNAELRLLCAAVAGGALAAGVCSAFFDSFAFPMFYNIFAFVAGLAGACWRLSQRERAAATEPNAHATGHRLPGDSRLAAIMHTTKASLLRPTT
jgi:O-antigen ligase